MAKITYEDKVGITPRTVHINQVWDDDMNELKNVINALDDTVNSINAGGVNPTVVSAIWQSGFTFDCTAQNYPINNIFYSAPSTTVILSGSDATLDRIDLIVAKIPVEPVILGTIQVIEGTLATTALVVPPDYDPSEYYVIKQVIVRATATVPTDENDTVFTTEKIYADGIGEPTEWTFSSNSGTIVNSGGTIEATNPTTLHKATLTNDVPIPQITNLFGGSLSFKIKLKASLGTSRIFIKWFNGSSKIAETFRFQNGQYGLDGNSLEWQTITINASEFAFITNDDIDAIQIYPYKSFAGYELDDIQINVGGGVIIPTDTGIEEAPINGKPHARQDKNWIEISTPQKEVTTSTYTITDSDSGYQIWFNNATGITVTINTLTTDNFECEFYNEGLGSVTFQNGTATVGYPDGTTLITNKVATLLRKLSTTTYKLKGELV